MRDDNGYLEAAVVHIVWKSVTPTYYKVYPKTPNQMILDPEGDTIRVEIDADKYEKNKEFPIRE